MPRISPVRLSFEPFDPEDAELLVGWLSSEVWPFHVRERPEPAEIRSRLEAGDYTGDTRTFWVLLDGAERVGLVVLEYLSDLSPTTDFRVREAYRGRGIGGRMARWAAEYVFTTFPKTPASKARRARTTSRCGASSSVAAGCAKRTTAKPGPPPTAR